ncbi:MAG: leucine-rich repeat domain-containing protein [Metamycoplasmataceae bacterium]
MKLVNNKNITIESLSIKRLSPLLPTDRLLENNEILKSVIDLNHLPLVPINSNVKQFQGSILTKDDVIALGWDLKSSITLADWIQDAPNVIEISTSGTSGFAGTSAFSFNNNIINIEIPATIKKINYSTFFDATKLKNVTFEKGSILESIGDSAFALSHANIDTSDLTIKLPESLSFMGTSAFRFSNLKTIAIPNNITNLSDSLFEGAQLNSISFGNHSQLKGIGYHTFYDANLLTAIHVPSKVTSIGNDAFRNTSSLTSIVLPTYFKNHSMNLGLTKLQTCGIQYTSDALRPILNNTEVVVGSIIVVLLVIAIGIRDCLFEKNSNE